MNMPINALVSRLKSSSLFKDSFWALSGNVAGKGLSLIAGIAVARFLGNEAFGGYGMIKNNLAMVAMFSSFGLGYTATKFIAECRKSNSGQACITHKVATRITLAASAAMAAIVGACAGPIAQWLDAPELTRLLRLSAVAIVFNAVNTTQIGELAGFNAYKAIAFNNLLSGVVTFVLSVALTYFYGIDGAVIALAASLLANCMFNRVSLRKHIQQIDAVKVCKDDYKRIAKFSLPVALQESSYSLTHWIATVVLIKVASYGELGIYSVAAQWMAVMLFVPGALRNVSLSHLSASNNNIASNKSVLKKMAMANLASTLVPFAIVAALSGWLCSLYGDTYVGLRAVLNVCMFTTVVSSLTNVLTQNMIALGHNWFLFVTRLARDLMTMGVAYCAMALGGRGALAMALSSLLMQTLYLLLLLAKQRVLYKNLAH